MQNRLKIFLVTAGIAAIFASVTLFYYLGWFQGVLLSDRLFSGLSPFGILAIFAILVFGGVYFFNASAHISSGAVK